LPKKVDEMLKLFGNPTEIPAENPKLYEISAYIKEFSVSAILEYS